MSLAQHGPHRHSLCLHCSKHICCIVINQVIKWGCLVGLSAQKAVQSSLLLAGAVGSRAAVVDGNGLAAGATAEAATADVAIADPAATAGLEAALSRVDGRRHAAAGRRRWR